MFPEIVGQYCVDAAIRAFRADALPEQIETPYAILTKETLSDFYKLTDLGWELQWDHVQKQLEFPAVLENCPIPDRVTPAELYWYLGTVS